MTPHKSIDTSLTLTEKSSENGCSNEKAKSVDEQEEFQQDITEIIASIMGLLIIKKQDKIAD